MYHRWIEKLVTKSLNLTGVLKNPGELSIREKVIYVSIKYKNHNNGQQLYDESITY